MEEQYKKTFDQMVDSLKMYQRYELKDKNRKDILDKVYVCLLYTSDAADE